MLIYGIHNVIKCRLTDLTKLHYIAAASHWIRTFYSGYSGMFFFPRLFQNWHKISRQRRLWVTDGLCSLCTACVWLYTPCFFYDISYPSDETGLKLTSAQAPLLAAAHERNPETRSILFLIHFYQLEIQITDFIKTFSIFNSLCGTWEWFFICLQSCLDQTGGVTCTDVIKVSGLNKSVVPDAT